jgi:hypothetical protein
MVGDRHNYDVESQPFWTSDCGRYTCSTLGTPSRGFELVPMEMGHDWIAAYEEIYKTHGNRLHRFKTKTEAEKSFTPIVGEII